MINSLVADKTPAQNAQFTLAEFSSATSLVHQLFVDL
jgi:hypothetical protein